MLVTGDEDWRSVKIDEPISSTTQAESKSQKQTSQSASNQAAEQHHSSKRQLNILGPVAKSLINLYEIDITKIRGTGPHGLVLKRFVS